MHVSRVAAVLLAAALAWRAGLAAVPPEKGPTAEEITKAEAEVKKYLGEIGGDNAAVQTVRDPAVDRTLPGRVWVAVRFRRYPVAQAPPKGLTSSNLLITDGDAKTITVVPDVPTLAGIFTRSETPVTDEEKARDAARAWLRLSQELHQDGFYEFTTVEESVKVERGDGLVVQGKYIASKGGNGEVTVRMTVKDGKVRTVVEGGELKPGPRPKCQGTKLLDPDPEVRRICEDNLLIMGPACLGYLAEQRAKASPELQREIDRVRQRIERGER
jgi:hypothetical protein